MSTQKIAGLLFDKDGTIIDFFQTWASAYDQAAHHVARGDAALDPSDVSPAWRRITEGIKRRMTSPPGGH